MKATEIPTVSVIIASYATERWSYLSAAVASVRAQTVIPDEIIVVVDHNPALFERARAAFTDILVLENTAGRGASGARNCGVAAARGDVVAFIDDDVSAAAQWLAQLLPPYADPCVLGVGGAIDPAWEGGRPIWFPDEFAWVVGSTYRGLPTTPTPIRNLIAANMSVRRAAFQSLGGFRAGFGKVGARPRPEETDLCIVARQRWPTGQWLYVPAARVDHHVPRERGRFGYFCRRCYEEGRGKADLVDLVGARDSLSAERDYVSRVLPAGVARGLGEVLRCGDLSGLSRAASILGGLALTAAGYIHGRALTRGYAAAPFTSWSGAPRSGAPVAEALP